MTTRLAPDFGSQLRTARAAYRREAEGPSAKVWWHRDLAPAHTSRAAVSSAGPVWITFEENLIRRD